MLEGLPSASINIYHTQSRRSWMTLGARYMILLLEFKAIWCLLLCIFHLSLILPSFTSFRKSWLPILVVGDRHYARCWKLAPWWIQFKELVGKTCLISGLWTRNLPPWLWFGRHTRPLPATKATRKEYASQTTKLEGQETEAMAALWHQWPQKIILT